MSDLYTKAMFGMSAVHVPLHFIIQDQSDGIVAIIGACRMPKPHPLRFGSKKCHQLFLGDAVFRPHLVCESNKLKGVGLAGLITSSAATNADEWERILIKEGMPV